MKTMHKIMTVTALLLGLLVLSGCSTNTNGQQSGLFGNGDSEGESSSSSTQGVQLQFADNRPPQPMYKGQPATFAFIFVNHQRHPVDDMRVRTWGFDRGYVNGLQEEISLSSQIPQATESQPGRYGGLVVDGVTVDGFDRSYPFDPKFDYCYGATTTYREQLCVPSVQNTCEGINVDRSQSQNGPVSVSIEEIQVPNDQIIVHFSLQNNGPGQVVNECFNTEDYARNYQLGEVRLGSQTGDCRPESSNEFALYDGNSNFVCTFPRQQDEAYASQISVSLDYQYQHTEELSIDVRSLDNS